tara:strand:+ start:11 stop:634 length:624 start_codon:yes stop_codon:yes gene_type:complete
MAINNHIVNTGGRGNNMFSETFHGLRRTQDGKLYYTLRDKNVGTFSNDGGTTELTTDADYVAVVEEYISGKDQTFAGDGSDKTFTITDNGREADQLAVFVDRVRMTATTDYTLSGTTLTFVRAPHNAAEIFVRVIKKEYKNESTDTYQQYKFESGRNHYKLNSDGKLVRIENKKMPVDEVNFPDDVLDSEFAAYNGASIVNSTTWSV